MGIKLLLNTTRYLKPIQVFYRLWYLIRKKLGVADSIKLSNNGKHNNHALTLTDSICNYTSYKSDNTFYFLNIKHYFDNKIDWNYLENGRLWSYNLNYFEYLNQKYINTQDAIKLINNFCISINENEIGLEPYPLSLRIMNWIKFFIANNIFNEQYNSSLYSQLKLLCRNKEYHLLGNHLLENGFALLWGAYYFNDTSFYKLSKKILLKELDEQILKDGGHFEQSPMYHNLITYRILDCYNLITNNNLFNRELNSFFKTKAEAMVAFTKTITFSNGNIPLLNDAAFNVAPTSEQLLTYANRLSLEVKDSLLSDSGYRFLKNDKIELFFDTGKIASDYQPGHTHADIFSFELYLNNRPVIVDTGTSTYEVNTTRFYERSTLAHNTVTINKLNSIQVWAGHRVGKRARVKILKDENCKIIASHNGFFNSSKVLHTRSVEINSKEVIIEDDIKTVKGEAYFHFAPDEDITITENKIIGTDFFISFDNYNSIEIKNTYYSPKFNLRISNKCIVISFIGKLRTNIKTT